MPLQRTLRVPVLREGHAPATIARSSLPAPLHLASSLLRYSPLTPRERLSAVVAARALQRLDPADPALDEPTFGDWLDAHRQSAAAVEGLWDLIALPTLNLPAREASLAAAVKVFRTGVLDTASGGDIGVPSVCFRELHAEPARRVLEQAGGRVVTSARVGGVSERLELSLDEATVEADAVVVAVPHDAAAALLPDAAVDRAALAQLGTSPIVNLHVHYDCTSRSRRHSTRHCSGCSIALPPRGRARAS
jgi:predicted NAD/FAD-binding protein